MFDGVGEARPVPGAVKSASVTLVLTVPFPAFGDGAGTGSVLLLAGTSGEVATGVVIVEEPDGEVCGKGSD